MASKLATFARRGMIGILNKKQTAATFATGAANFKAAPIAMMQINEESGRVSLCVWHVGQRSRVFLTFLFTVSNRLHRKCFGLLLPV